MLAWAFQGVPFDAIVNRLLGVNYLWIVISIVIGIFSHWLRAFRWNMLLKPVHGEISTKTSFPIVLSMYLVNLIIPRGGELYRCGALKKTNDVALSTSVGTVIAERVIDLVMLMFFLVVMLFVEADKFHFIFQKMLPKDSGLFTTSSITLIVISVLIVLVILALIWWKFRTFSFVQKARDFIKELLKGFSSILRLDNKLAFVLTTIGIWVCYYFMSYLVVFATPETDNLSFEVGFMLLALGGIAMSAPVQGGIGAFHILVSQGLALYNLPTETGIFFATLLHGSQVIMILISGSISFLYLALVHFNKRNDKVQRKDT